MLSCPSEQDLTLFVQRQLAEADRERIRDHLDECDPCRLGIVAGLSLRATAPAQDASRETDLAGACLGPFDLVGRLGAGGMGTVYEAIDRRLGRAVALKLVRGDQARLLEEARAMAGVRHPSVLTVFEAGELDGSVYLATELIRGTTLRDQAGRARPRILLAMYRRAAEGLAAAHAHGLIHRDFKPDNVLVEHPASADHAARGGEIPRVLVADFGLATAMTSAGAAEAAPAGTPAYMAPEQIDGEPLDARVDVFAFCVSLWEARTGARPFAGATLAALRDAMRTLPRPPREVPRRLRALLVRGLSEVPAARPAIAELITALAPRRGARIAGAAAGLCAVVLATVLTWPRTADLATTCAAAPTPARVTASGLARAAIPPWVRRRVATHLDARDREVVALQRRTCATDDDAIRHAWIGCRHEHAIEEVALVASLAAPWPTYDRLDDALELPWPSTCASRAARLDAVLVPTEPRARARLDTARADLARARLAGLAGRTWQLASDGPLGPERLLLEASRETTTTARLELLARAVERAEREAHVTTAARAWLELATARGRAEVDDPAAVELAISQASWAIDRAGDPPMLRARWHATSAAHAWQRADLAGAQRHARAAAALAGDDPRGRRIAIRSLAAAAAARADFPAQRALLETLADDLGGDTDLDAAQFHTAYAECLYHLGDLAPAHRAADRGLAMIRATAGDRDPLTAEALLIRGFIELDEGDPAACARTVSEALAILEAAVGHDHPTVGAALNLRSSARAEVEDWAGALADSEAAAALLEHRLGPRAEQVIFARTQIGELAPMLGDHVRARAALSRALPDARITYGPDDPRTADVERSLATLLIADHQTVEARALLEHAIAVHTRAHSDPAYLAQIQADLARLTNDHALARRVLAIWKDQPAWTKASRSLATWLATAAPRR